MKLIKITCLFLCQVSFVGYTGNAQTIQKNTVIMPAGARYAASHWKEFWWGKHWRVEWLQPVQFPVFDLDTTAGGLVPLERGGGHETKTLRLLGHNGKEYVLRTMDKSLDVLVPEQFKGSFVNDLVNDQISTAHPYGPLVVSRLSANLGILHTNPIIVFVPDNPRLAEFKNDFANKLCLFEERPSGQGWDHSDLTLHADRVINSEKLFEKLRSDNISLVDQHTYLKVRLFDMMINDWDRHEDQWVWAVFKKNDKMVYVPFARDRDQSFAKTDGLNLFFLSLPWAVRALQHMHRTLPDVIGSNLSATALDKQFLNSLTEKDWQKTIAAIQNTLTDSVINQSVRKLPAPIHALSADFLNDQLEKRRDNMMRYGIKYYKIINKEVTITGSDKPERFIIYKPSVNTVDVTILSIGDSGRISDTIYHRVFNHKTTKSITVYGLEGDDEFVYRGRKKNKILTRSLGNDGRDRYIDQTGKIKRRRNIIYDEAADKPSSSGLMYRTTGDTSFTNYKRRYFRYDWWSPLLVPGYNPDDGVVIGSGFTYKKQKWNKSPFGWQQTIGGSYAASTGAYSLYYSGIFKKFFGQWDLNLYTDYKSPTYIINFYGLGNDSRLVINSKSFYRIHASSFLAKTGISRSWNKNTFHAGISVSTVKVKQAENKFINLSLSGIDSSVYSTKYFGGASVAYDFSTVNDSKFPTKGFNYHLKSGYQLNLKDAKRSLMNLQSYFTCYFTPVRNITLAHRTGGSTIFGDYEFYQAATLGGMDNLRGYWRTRFSGRSSFYQNTEIRLKLADLKGYIVRGNFGVYGFFDDGRVWYADEHSAKIHTGYGAGAYLIPYNTLALNLSFASSRETNEIIFRTGFLF